jgi:hypothetical protein
MLGPMCLGQLAKWWIRTGKPALGLLLAYKNLIALPNGLVAHGAVLLMAGWQAQLGGCMQPNGSAAPPRVPAVQPVTTALHAAAVGVRRQNRLWLCTTDGVLLSGGQLAAAL